MVAAVDMALFGAGGLGIKAFRGLLSAVVIDEMVIGLGLTSARSLSGIGPFCGLAVTLWDSGWSETGAKYESSTRMLRRRASLSETGV